MAPQASRAGLLPRRCDEPSCHEGPPAPRGPRVRPGLRRRPVSRKYGPDQKGNGRRETKQCALLARSAPAFASALPGAMPGTSVRRRDRASRCMNIRACMVLTMRAHAAERFACVVPFAAHRSSLPLGTGHTQSFIRTQSRLCMCQASGTGCYASIRLCRRPRVRSCSRGGIVTLTSRLRWWSIFL